MDPILKLLEKNGRQTPESIADQLERPLEEVREKILDFEKRGVIVRYKAVINEEKLGKPEKIRALIEVRVKPQKDKGFDGIAEKIYRFPEVTSCMLLSGSFDLLVEVSGEDLHTISNFVSEKLSQIENVYSTVTHFILKRYKENGDIFFLENHDERLPVSP